MSPSTAAGKRICAVCGKPTFFKATNKWSLTVRTSGGRSLGFYEVDVDATTGKAKAAPVTLR